MDMQEYYTAAYVTSIELLELSWSKTGQILNSLCWWWLRRYG